MYNNSLFEKFQLGFSTGQSTETAFFKVLNDPLLAAGCGQHTVLLLLDEYLWLLTVFITVF